VSTVVDPLDGPGFSAVDADPDAQMLVGALDEQSSLPAVQRLRASATELLGPRFGHRLLDVGCGTGNVARALAALVGPDGLVVGIDASETMLAEARRRTADKSASVDFRHGDINRLDFDDASFDGTHCERVFQHLRDVDTAMAELVRVTRPGGRIVAADSDWGMHAIHGADPRLTSRVIECWSDRAANGWSGRQLPARFAASGLRDTRVVAETLTSTDPHRPTAPPFTVMAAVAEHSGGLSSSEARTWLAQLADAGTRGAFFWAVTMFAVGGTRP
jgi:SAM-dependent methyltransferase